MKSLNVLYLTDKFLTYEVMHNSLNKYLKEIDISVVPDSIESDWPDLYYKNDEEIKEYIDVDEVLAKKIVKKDIVITHVAGIKGFHIQMANDLKIIGCIRSMPINIDVRAAMKRGIPIVYAPGRSTEAVAEFTMGLIINLRRKIYLAQKKIKLGRWESDFFTYEKAAISFDKQTIGIIGFGNIGRRVCELLKPYHCRIIIYDPYVDNSIVEGYGIERTYSLKELLNVSDIITIHARTHNLEKEIIGENELKQMKSSAYLINTARGYIIDYESLYRFLKDKKIAGAALDTYNIEPLPKYHPLLSLDNVIATPHIAGATRSTAEEGIKMVSRGIFELLRGNKPKNIFTEKN